MIETQLVIKRHLFSVEDYRKMVEAGILHEDSPVELIEGEIIRMAPIGPRHKAAVNRLTALLVRGLGDRAIVQIQSSIRLSRHSEPEPDVVLLRYRADFYWDMQAGPADVLLIIEIAESSLAYDSVVKARLYAAAGIPELWIGDIKSRSVRRYTDPSSEGYRLVEEIRGQDRLSPAAFPDFLVTVAQILE